MFVSSSKWLTAFLVLLAVITAEAQQNYGDALSKSILFFEGQRSGKLPKTQRVTWRKDSALRDGSDHGVDLTGGYYDAGDNVKYSFPMAFTATMLSWSVLDYGYAMGNDLGPALQSIQWATDFLLKATAQNNVVYAMVGEPNADHSCWDRPEDMDTPRTSFFVTDKTPGSEVSGEIAAALAAASLVFKSSNPSYSKTLLDRAFQVFNFADKFRGSYNTSLGKSVCPFYCDYDGYQDELIWAAAWIYKATGTNFYWDYVKNNIKNIVQGSSDFGWDAKHAGINVLASQFVLSGSPDFNLFVPNADAFICKVLPESPGKTEQYTRGGLIMPPVVCGTQRTTAASFLVLTYGNYLQHTNRTFKCGNVFVTPNRLIQFAKSQVDYLLGNNPMKTSYMVGYGGKFPQHIHHRGSSVPSIDKHPQRIACKDGWTYFQSNNPNQNLLIGAVVGGPDLNDQFADSRKDAGHSEPTTYVNAPLVGLLAHFKAHPSG